MYLRSFTINLYGALLDLDIFYSGVRTLGVSRRSGANENTEQELGLGLVRGYHATRYRGKYDLYQFKILKFIPFN